MILAKNVDKIRLSGKTSLVGLIHYTMRASAFELRGSLIQVHDIIQGAQAKFVHFEFSRYFKNLYNFDDILRILKSYFGTLLEIARKFKVYEFCLRTLYRVVLA